MEEIRVSSERDLRRFVLEYQDEMVKDLSKEGNRPCAGQRQT